MTNVKISIPEDLINKKILQINFVDIIKLLSEYFKGEVTFDSINYDLLINVTINPYLENRNFNISYKANEKIIYIEAKSEQDIVYSFYTFMAEVLNFVFLHPEEMLLPDYDRTIFLKDFILEAESLFDIRGFHLHTLHPIEMTHFLFEEGVKHKDYIKRYIDHLVRLGQNTFQFYLLEKTNLKNFIPYIKEIIEYAHNKGVNVGIMLSLYRIQQYSFKLFKLSKILNLFECAKIQIDKILEAPFDYVVLETPLGEFLPDLMKFMPRTVKQIEDYIIDKKNVPLYYSKHIVKKDHEIMEPHEKLELTSKSKAHFLFRTVMCFSLLDDCMGAYENKNFTFVYEDMLKYKDKKQVIFWPTIAYWVCFDNTVPLFLFPYFKARFMDCKINRELKVSGHITFSSGFEWGGFLIEFAVASYTWEIKRDGETLKIQPLSFLKKIVGNDTLYTILEHLYEISNDYIINKKLLPLITAEDPFLEFPIFNHTFQPRPKFTLKYIRRNIKGDEINKLEYAIEQLKEFSEKLTQDLELLRINIEELYKEKHNNIEAMLEEIYNYLKVLNFRINHRINIYYAALYCNFSNKKKCIKAMRYLIRAKRIRLEALKIVEKNKKNYRYEEKYIDMKLPNKTAYEFSYFSPAIKLFFWELEEKKVLYNKFNPFFMKLWDFSKILGFK